MENKSELTVEEEGLQVRNSKFNPFYRIGEEHLDSMRCRCSCAPSPGPYCGKARQE